MSATERTMPEPVERVRMALAEVGYGPENAWVGPRGALHVDWFLPSEVGWRACSAAYDPADPSDRFECFACYEHAKRTCRDADRDDCLSSRPFEQDCGVQR